MSGRKFSKTDISKRFISVCQVVMTRHNINTDVNFCKEIGIHTQIFYDIKVGKLQVGIDLVSILLKKYSEISPEWLLTGEGEMLKKTHQLDTNIGHRGNNSKIIGNIEINTYQSDLEKANIKIELLEKIIKDKEKIIELLTKNQ